MLPTTTGIESCNRHIHQSHRQRALRPIGRAVAAGNKSFAGPPQTCLLQITGMIPLYLPHTVPARGRQQRTRNKHRTHVLDSYYRGHPARSATNIKRSGDSGVAPPGSRSTGTAMAPCNKSSAGPQQSQLDAAGFSLSLPPPLGGTVPDPTIASAICMFSTPLP